MTNKKGTCNVYWKINSQEGGVLCILKSQPIMRCSAMGYFKRLFHEMVMVIYCYVLWKMDQCEGVRLCILKNGSIRTGSATLYFEELTNKNGGMLLCIFKHWPIRKKDMYFKD